MQSIKKIDGTLLFDRGVLREDHHVLFNQESFQCVRIEAAKVRKVCCYRRHALQDRIISSQLRSFFLRFSQRVILFCYTDNSGVCVRTGRRQSMPSNSIDNCARVSATVPDSAFGQMKRPRSSRFANRHNPSLSHQSSLIRSPRRPRKTNT